MDRCVENSGKEQRKEGLMWSRSNLQQPQSIFWAKRLSIKSVGGTQIISAVVNSSHPPKLKALLTTVTFLQFFKGQRMGMVQPPPGFSTLKTRFYFYRLLNIILFARETFWRILFQAIGILHSLKANTSVSVMLNRNVSTINWKNLQGFGFFSDFNKPFQLFPF